MLNIFLLSSTLYPSEDKEQTRKWRRTQPVLTQQDSLCGLCFFSLFVLGFMCVIHYLFFWYIYLQIFHYLSVVFIELLALCSTLLTSWLKVVALQHVYVVSHYPSRTQRQDSTTWARTARRWSPSLFVSPLRSTFDLACGCQTCGICRRQVCVVRHSRGILHFGGICCLKPGINWAWDSITAECLFSLRLPGPSTCPLLKPRERFQSLFWYLPYVTSQRADSPNVTFSTHVLKGWTTRAESGWNSFFF